MRSIRLTALRRQGQRITVVALGGAAVLGLVAAPAQASSWTSSLTNVAPSFESRRWTDDGGPTNVQFENCTDDYESKVTIGLRKDVLGPDDYFTTHTYTECFEGSGHYSSGNWDGHGEGDYYFVVNDFMIDVHMSAKWVGTYY